MILAGVHGIGYRGDGFGALWTSALDLGVRVSEVSWSSSDNPARDARRILLDGKYRRRAIADVAGQIDELLDGPPFVVLAHSMGQPIALAAMREVGEFPIVTIGGPLTHPVWGRALATVGLGAETPGRKIVEFWNRDDRVCSSGWLGHRAPSWFDSAEVALAGSEGLLREHADVFYLSHPLVRSGVRSCLGLS